MDDKLKTLSDQLTKTINHEIELTKGSSAPTDATLQRVAANLKNVIDNELVRKVGDAAAFDQSHSSGGGGGGSVRRTLETPEAKTRQG